MKKNNSVSVEVTKKYRKNKKLYENTHGTKTEVQTVIYENGKPEVYDSFVVKFINACRLDLASENEW